MKVLKAIKRVGGRDTDIEIPFSGDGGGSLPVNWAETGDGGVEVTDPNTEQVYFKITPADREVFAGFLRAYNGFTVDDCPLEATNDNGDVYFKLKPNGVGSIEINGITFDPSPQPTPDLAAVIASGNSAGDAITDVTDPTNAQDAATKASTQAQADAAEQNAKDYADGLSTPWQAGTGIHVLQGAVPAVLVNSPATFYSWAVDAIGLVTVNFGAEVDVGTATTDNIVVGFPDLPLGSLPTFNRSGALGCVIGGTEYNLFADISAVETEVTIVPAHVPAIQDPLVHDDRIAGMFSYPAA